MGKSYFLSDVHLGLPVGDPKKRERMLVQFLAEIEKDSQTSALFLLGDIFDFWYEYKYVVPKGFTRVLGALAAITDKGIPVHFFAGNHDMWTFGYLEEELGLIVHPESFYTEWEGKHFLLAHGDGVPPMKGSYKRARAIFKSPVTQTLFSALHPRWSFALAMSWSAHNRLARGETYQFRGEKEPVYQFAANYPQKVDYCIVGHLHTPERRPLPGGGELLVLGDWINNPSVACAVGGDSGVLGGSKERSVEVVESPVMIHLD